MILLADKKGPDQTVRMRRLIWVFAVRICPKTRFGMAWLICRWNCIGIKEESWALIRPSLSWNSFAVDRSKAVFCWSFPLLCLFWFLVSLMCCSAITFLVILILFAGLGVLCSVSGIFSLSSCLYYWYMYTFTSSGIPLTLSTLGQSFSRLTFEIVLLLFLILL